MTRHRRRSHPSGSCRGCAAASGGRTYYAAETRLDPAHAAAGRAARRRRGRGAPDGGARPARARLGRRAGRRASRCRSSCTRRRPSRAGRSSRSSPPRRSPPRSAPGRRSRSRTTSWSTGRKVAGILAEASERVVLGHRRQRRPRAVAGSRLRSTATGVELLVEILDRLERGLRGVAGPAHGPLSAALVFPAASRACALNDVTGPPVHGSVNDPAGSAARHRLAVHDGGDGRRLVEREAQRRPRRRPQTPGGVASIVNGCSSETVPSGSVAVTTRRSRRRADARRRSCRPSRPICGPGAELRREHRRDGRRRRAGRRPGPCAGWASVKPNVIVSFTPSPFGEKATGRR